MDIDQVIKGLKRNKGVFAALLENRTEEEYRFKPSQQQWCMLEVICHLLDEEREDFRTRVKLILANPEQELPKFNPLDWVHERNYLDQNFRIILERFIEEREVSIAWLTNLHNPNWENAYNHPKLGPLTAEFFLTNWLAHDYIHIQQINRL